MHLKIFIGFTLVFSASLFSLSLKAQTTETVTQAQIASAENEVTRSKNQVADNMNRIAKACTNSATTKCITEKREVAKMEGNLQGAETALRELKRGDLSESAEYAQRTADSAQLRVWVEKKCRSAENYKICEKNTIQLEETAAWLQVYFRLKWPNG